MHLYSCLLPIRIEIWWTEGAKNSIGCSDFQTDEQKCSINDHSMAVTILKSSDFIPGLWHCTNIHSSLLKLLRCCRCLYQQKLTSPELRWRSPGWWCHTWAGSPWLLCSRLWWWCGSALALLCPAFTHIHMHIFQYNIMLHTCFTFIHLPIKNKKLNKNNQFP